MRVENAVIGCGVVDMCDDGAGRAFMGVCFRYFGPSLFSKGDVPRPLPGSRARTRDGAVSFEEARQSCVAWGGDLAVVNDRGRMEVVRSLLHEHAWVGVKAVNGSDSLDSLAPLTWIDGTPVTDWGEQNPWGSACSGGMRSGDCPFAVPTEAACVVVGLGGLLRSTTCSGRGGANDGDSSGAEGAGGVVRGWVCEKLDGAGAGARVQVSLSVRSSRGTSAFDAALMRVAASCGDGCACDVVAGCTCEQSGAVLGEFVSQPVESNGWWELVLSFWMVPGLDCFISVEDTRGATLGAFLK